MSDPMSYGDLLMDVMTGPPRKPRKKTAGFAARVRNEIAATTKRKRKAKTTPGKSVV